MARRCGYCYGRGHNKRTCPQITESYIRRYQTETEENTKAHWAQLVRARGVNPDTGKALTVKEKKARTGYAKQARACKYCDESGHNSRTCTTKKSDIKLINETAKEFRIAAAEKIKRHEFPKTGALLQYYHPREWTGSQNGYQPISEIHMVTGIKWERVTFDRAFGGYTDWLTLINLGAPGRPRHAGNMSHWRVDKERRNHNGKLGDSGWSALSNPAEYAAPKPPSEWWDAEPAGSEGCRFIQTGVCRNKNAMRIFEAALRAMKEGCDIDMSHPRTWASVLQEAGYFE